MAALTPDFAADLVAALAKLATVEKGNTADTGKYSYNYADIADVVKLTRPILHEHNLTALTPVHGHGDDLACSVMLVHTSGEVLRFDPLTFPHGNDAQATGSAITYHRRYALLAALGMAADEDDDGAKASERPRQRRSQSSTTEPSSATGPTEAQERFIGKLAGSNTAAVRELAAKVHGSPVELADLPRSEVSALIDELKEWAKQAAADERDIKAATKERAAEVGQLTASGEEPF
jgi:hypothetical protein